MNARAVKKQQMQNYQPKSAPMVVREASNESPVLLPAVTPMQLMQVAMSKDADLTTLERLMDLQMKYEANEARKMFVADMALLKKNPPEILKMTNVSFTTRDGEKTSYNHADLAEVTEKIGKALGDFGFSHNWDVVQDAGQIRVTCKITHRAGHSESVTMIAPPDVSGKKNSIQAIASTVSYLQRYTLKAAAGFAEKHVDNDGRGDDDDEAASELAARSFTDGWIAKIEACTNTEAARKVAHEAAAACEATANIKAYNEIKAATQAHVVTINKRNRESAT